MSLESSDTQHPEFATSMILNGEAVTPLKGNLEVVVSHAQMLVY